MVVPVYVKRPLHTAQPAHTVAHTGTLHASARPVAYTFAPARLRAAGGSEPRHPLLEGGDAVLDVRRVGEDDGGHDGSEVVGQVVAPMEAAVLGAVPPALLVARAARTELDGGARAGGEPAEHLSVVCL